MDMTIVERVAKNVGCAVDALMAEQRMVREERGNTFLSSGKTEEECDMLCLRIAAQQVRSREAALAKSGCSLYEGVFVSVPRTKDWAKFAYEKTRNQLNGLSLEARLALVKQGILVLYTQGDDGAWTKHYNLSLSQGIAFVEGSVESVVSGPDDRNCMSLEDGSQFYMVADNRTPTWPSGSPNFRYGKSRQQSEPERTSLFYGRKKGDTNLSLMTVRTSGSLAKASFPTFTTGTVALRPNANGDVLYGKDNVTVFNADESLSSIFPGPPVEWLGSLMRGDKKLVHQLDTLDAIPTYVDTLGDKEKWDALVGTMLEVIHIDPRERGGFVVTLSDSDIMCMAPPTDIFIPASQEDTLDFGVGSMVLAIGSPWVTQEGEARLSTTGWWCMDRIIPAMAEEESEGGWDE
jgi:hypothetical protein